MFRAVLPFVMLAAAIFLFYPNIHLDSYAVSMNIENQIFIENFSARVTNLEISHSATFVNQMDSNIVFDAIIRIDNQTETIALDPRTVELEPRGRVTINGAFEVDAPGSYTIQWEALTPPPGEALADRRRVDVIVQQDLVLSNLLAIAAVLTAGTILAVLLLRQRQKRFSRLH